MNKINYFIFPGLPTYFKITEKEIFDAIEGHLNISKEQIMDKKKPAKVTDARKIFLSLYYENMGIFTEKKSLSQLGKIVNINHASVLYSIKRANELRKIDNVFNNNYKLIESSVLEVPKMLAK